MIESPAQGPVASAPQSTLPPQEPPRDRLAEASEVARDVSSLFDEFRKELVLSDGRKVEVTPGKTRHFGLLLRMFETALDNLDPNQLGKLFHLIANKQLVAIAQGRNPLEVILKEGEKTIETEEGTRKAVAEVMGTSSLVLSFVQSAWSCLPEVVEAMTNLKGEQWLDLEMDDGAAVVFSIVAMNYDFFFQSSRPLLLAVGASLRRRAAELKAQ